MSTLDRTAYPRFPRVITARDLVQRYTPAPDEIQWVSEFARSGSGRLGLLVLLKVFQQFHYFPTIELGAISYNGAPWIAVRANFRDMTAKLNCSFSLKRKTPSIAREGLYPSTA